MVSSINTGNLRKNGINFGIISLDLGVNDGVRVVEESHSVAGCQKIELTNLALTGRELMLANHQVLEIISK